MYFLCTFYCFLCFCQTYLKKHRKQIPVLLSKLLCCLLPFLGFYYPFSGAFHISSHRREAKFIKKDVISYYKAVMVQSKNHWKHGKHNQKSKQRTSKEWDLRLINIKGKWDNHLKWYMHTPAWWKQAMQMVNRSSEDQPDWKRAYMDLKWMKTISPRKAMAYLMRWWEWWVSETKKWRVQVQLEYLMAWR